MSALSRDSLGALGRKMHADDSGVSRAEWGEESALFVAPSATSGRSHGTFFSSRELIRDRQTRFKFQRLHSWRVLGTFWADS